MGLRCIVVSPQGLSVSSGHRQIYPGSVRYVRAVRAAGLRTAVVCCSANCAEVLKRRVSRSCSRHIDAISGEKQHRAGKPAPDTYLAAAKLLGGGAYRRGGGRGCPVGVAAGRAGEFGFVVGVDWVGQAGELRAHGADRVVTDIAQLLDPALSLDRVGLA